ncbi:MAG TPA: S41 family peptidase [Myxococcota bacterium]|nr:S41 family peptidase [Myxococcota bacterium]
MKRLQLLATLLLPACTWAAPTAPAPALDAQARQDVIEHLIDEMNRRYVFPDVARRVEAALRADGARAFDGITDGREFAARLTRSLQDVTHDKHVRVRYSDAPVPVRQRPDDDRPTPAQLAAWREEESKRNFGVERVERLPGNIGYVELRGFAPAPLAAPALAAAMTLVAHADALVIDLRRNGGGDPETVALVCSYLFEHRTHLNDLQWREGDRIEQFWTQEWVPGERYGETKPVYVLTSSHTFSGAEEFSYNLRALGRATLVGETTGGGANPGDLRRLTEHFEVFVPTGRAVNPITKTNWEGVGVEPHVKTTASLALSTAEALALRALIDREQDGERRGALQKRLDDVQKTLGAPG